MAPRPGFIIYNAPDVGGNLDVAEPDALDFNLLGNQNYGVISGCAASVTGSGWTVNVTQGIYVIAGQVVSLSANQTGVASSNQDPRFDLIAGDTTGKAFTIPGVEATNPVFPDYDDKCCVFAAVLILPGQTPPLQAQVTDKRVMILQRFMTAVINGSAILANQDPTPGNGLATLFKIEADGTTWWSSDVSLGRYKVGGIRATGDVDVTGTLSAHDVSAANNVTAASDLIGSNFRQGSGPPTAGMTPAPSNGDLYKNITDGTVWVWQGAAWDQMSTTVIPPGMTMTSFLSSPPLGWLLVDGSKITKAQAGGLWTVFPGWILDANTMQLPDATNRFFAWGAPGVRAGPASSMVSLSVANMPAHKHLVSPTTAAGGNHTHPSAYVQAAGGHGHTTLQPSGAHIHEMYDPGHTHGAPLGSSTGFICTDWTGMNRVDGPFNDASHTYAVEEFKETAKNVDVYGHGTTGIQTTTASSNHDHPISSVGDHTHQVVVGDASGSTHTHPITENTVGGGQPFDIRPPFMGMFLMIKT